MKNHASLLALSLSAAFASTATFADHHAVETEPIKLINAPANGYRGIWYMNQPSDDVYKYKYSGGLGTYTAKHRPFAIHVAAQKKTFFTYGATDEQNSAIYHAVSYFDHRSGQVANPTLILDKQTTDAHDNPVISVDDDGHIWIFSTSHGTSRPSYITRSARPFDVSEFELVQPTELVDGERVPFDNFSYFQIWRVQGKGFFALLTKYRHPIRYGKPTSHRTIGYNTSPDGVTWGEWRIIADFEGGHYQISREKNGKVGVAFNMHPASPQERSGVNYRTNLYYLETADFGETWQNGDGAELTLHLTEVENGALVEDYRSRGLNVYLKDLAFDEAGNPNIMVIASKGYESGPKNDPRAWTLFQREDSQWTENLIATSDNNYDMGSLYARPSDPWLLIAPTEPGPQAYNPGGEVALWSSEDSGKHWTLQRQLTQSSAYNHTYVRRPINAHEDFFALWADGHGRQPSPSRLYFSDREGNAYRLPQDMEGDFAEPQPVHEERFRNAGYTDQKTENAARKLAFANASDPQRWQTELRTQLKDMLGFPEESPPPLDPIVTLDSEEETFARYRVEFNSTRGERVPAYLLIPTKGEGPFPVMICMQGHTQVGMQLSMDPDAPGGRDMALAAIRNGWAALALEQRGYGERGGASCNHLALQTLMLGESLIGHRVSDVSRAIDFLETREEIDTSRLGSMGNSGGGTTTFYAAAIDPRIRLAVVSCSFCTFEKSWLKHPHCSCGYISGILDYADMGDIGGLIAPRHLMIVAGRHDPLADIDGVKEAFATTKRAYKAFGHDDRASLIIGDGGHQFYPDQAWPRMNAIRDGWSEK